MSILIFQEQQNLDLSPVSKRSRFHETKTKKQFSNRSQHLQLWYLKLMIVFILQIVKNLKTQMDEI